MIIGCRYLQAGDASAHGIIEAVLREQGLGLRRDVTCKPFAARRQRCCCQRPPEESKYHGAIDVSL